MFIQAKKPMILAVLFTLASFMILTYQNCAKPLDEIGLNSALSGSGSCSINLSSTSVVLSSPLAIEYAYTPSSYKIRMVTMNNGSGAFIENIYSQSGTLSVTYTDAAEVGSYTVFGVVENELGNSVANCQASYNVTGRVMSGPNPPQTGSPQPTITLTGDTSTCNGACSVTLTHTASNLSGSGKVFKIVRNGTTASDVVCKSVDGAASNAVSLTYAANPGLNSFAAYLVATCATSTSGAFAAATFNVTVNPASTNYTYFWSTGNWGACSATACGTYGTQTRSVVCKRSDGANVADSNCSGTKPANSQSCYAGACGGGGNGGGGINGGGSCKIGDVNCQIQ